MNVSKRTPLSKEVMVLEAIKGIGKDMVRLAADMVVTVASNPPRVLLRHNHRQVHPELRVRPITAHNTPNTMGLAGKIPTQPTAGIKIMWRIINITPSRLHSKQPSQEPRLQANRAMILHPHHPRAACPLLLTVATIP